MSNEFGQLVAPGSADHVHRIGCPNRWRGSRRKSQDRPHRKRHRCLSWSQTSWNRAGLARREGGNTERPSGPNPGRWPTRGSMQGGMER